MMKLRLCVLALFRSIPYVIPLVAVIFLTSLTASAQYFSEKFPVAADTTLPFDTQNSVLTVTVNAPPFLHGSGTSGAGGYALHVRYLFGLQATGLTAGSFKAEAHIVTTSLRLSGATFAQKSVEIRDRNVTDLDSDGYDLSGYQPGDVITIKIFLEVDRMGLDIGPVKIVANDTLNGGANVQSYVQVTLKQNDGPPAFVPQNTYGPVSGPVPFDTPIPVATE